MKPRIFIAAHYLEIGGAEISLIGLLQAIDYSRYDVDLFVYHHVGELMRLIPKEVNLLPEIPIYAQFERPLKHTLFSRYWRIGLARLKTKWQYCQYAKNHECPDGNAYFQFLANNVTPLLPSLDYLGEYDLAINFIGLMNIVRDKVRAKKKVTWIHTDYSHISVYPEMELPVWDSFNHVISISEDVTKTFLKVFPALKDKIVEIENILSPEFVRQRGALMSRQELALEMPINDDYLNLLTIGRFSPPKKLEEIPAICRGVVDSGLNVRWYIIGYGGCDDYIRREIEREGMQEHVFLLGKKENPYPYIKACDWYVQPSRYEGKSVVVREAQMLCKPVIVTNYPTAPSQIQQGVDGVIVPMDIPGCVAQMVETLKNDKLKCSIVEYLEVHDYGNMGEVEKVYALLGHH